MNSVPLISHRLYVAAVGNASQVQAKSLRSTTVIMPAAGCATAIPLELVGSEKTGSAAGERSSRGSVPQNQR